MYMDDRFSMDSLLRDAKRGKWTAQALLGSMYRSGRGVEQNFTEAVKWYRMAAENENTEIAGSTQAKIYNNLGVLYATGRGVPQDYAESIKWLRKGAEMGLAEAQSGLAYAYANGNGVDPDLNEAVKWYRKAAAQGFPPAQDALRELGL